LASVVEGANSTEYKSDEATGAIMTERRRRARGDISSEVSFFFASGRSVLHGAALNISNTGAKLALDRFYALPRRFLLSFDQFTTAQSCSVMWSRGNFLGVKFEPAKLSPADNPYKQTKL
jgi:PilZ domain